VQIQSGQSRSGQAGSACCHSSGDWRVRRSYAGATGGGDATVPGFRPPAKGANDERPDSEQPTARRGR
jgi:hypothetical protein